MKAVGVGRRSPKEVLSELVNGARAVLDPELRGIRKVIAAERYRRGSSDAAVGDCDQLFARRMTVNPSALKMSFWVDHFEWKSLSGYPEIRGRILDFGCGSGHSDVMLARNGYFVHGIDLSPIGVAIANHLKCQEPPGVRIRLSFELADVTRDPPPPEPFDAAWASHVIEHILDPGPALNGLRAWLKPGAFLLVSVPLGSAYGDPSHVHRFGDATELAALLARHVDVVRTDAVVRDSVIRALCRY